MASHFVPKDASREHCKSEYLKGLGLLSGPAEFLRPVCEVLLLGSQLVASFHFPFYSLAKGGFHDLLGSCLTSTSYLTTRVHLSYRLSLRSEERIQDGMPDLWELNLR